MRVTDRKLDNFSELSLALFRDRDPVPALGHRQAFRGDLAPLVSLSRSVADDFASGHRFGWPRLPLRRVIGYS